MILRLWCGGRVGFLSRHTARSESCPASLLGVSVLSSPAVPGAMDSGQEPQYGACRCSRLALGYPADNPVRAVLCPGRDVKNRLSLSADTYFASVLSASAAIDRRRDFDPLHEFAPSSAFCHG